MEMERGNMGWTEMVVAQLTADSSHPEILNLSLISLAAIDTLSRQKRASLVMAKDGTIGGLSRRRLHSLPLVSRLYYLGFASHSGRPRPIVVLATRTPAYHLCMCSICGMCDDSLGGGSACAISSACPRAMVHVHTKTRV